MEGFLRLWQLRLVALLMVLLALLAAVLEVRMFARWIYSYTYHTTQGELLEVGSGGGRGAPIRVRYRYAVQGQTFEGTHLTVEGGLLVFSNVTGSAKERDLLVRHDRKLPVKVFYNPFNPADAFLIFGFPSHPVTHWIFCWFMWMGWATWRNFRQWWSPQGLS